ncbi:hypothetical protein [Anaerolinea thermophila]|uniref:Uncharacterized protein n=1 Tax=Anaerolinea thermophila (strain DSM 14523 / JCM 11388 / NBRC 100420 / UNI-1) TaxID=926569 RepID=E8N0L5_ANATU|nr:hypothetical protein [Anaerolinea thermophila]BAJ64764.1 hypothetical protein ANT_27380 [Anaerolinea thermophila UNI-1]
MIFSKRIKLLGITGIILLIGIVGLLVLKTINSSSNSSRPSIMLATIRENNGQRQLEFLCVETNNCLPSLDIENKHLENLASLHIGPTYYIENSNIFVSFWEANTLMLKLNTQTLETTYFDLGTDIDLGILTLPLNKNLILASSRGTLLVVNDNLLPQKIQLNLQDSNYIRQLVHRNESEVVALNNIPIKSGDTISAQIFIVNPKTGAVVEKHLPVPEFKELFPGEALIEKQKYNLTIASVSPDLRTLYYTYYYTDDGESLKTALGMFDTQTMNDKGFNYDINCVSMNGYSQYKGFLYSSKLYSEGGGDIASLIEMKFLKPLIPLDRLLGRPSKALITPFGKYFVLGTNHQVIVLTQNGTVVDEYELPLDWVGRDYVIVEYRE